MNVNKSLIGRVKQAYYHKNHTINDPPQKIEILVVYTSDIYLHGVRISNSSLQQQYLPLKQQERDTLNCPWDIWLQTQNKLGY